MNDPRLNLVRSALENYADPFLGETLGAAHAVDEVSLSEGRVKVRLRFGFPVGGYADCLAQALRTQIEGRACRWICNWSRRSMPMPSSVR
jgi:hypothetical protein